MPTVDLVALAKKQAQCALSGRDFIPWIFDPKPKGWDLEREMSDGAWWIHEASQMVVLSSVCREDDGKPWMHVSVSRNGRIPTYEDMCFVKKHWIGEDRKAIMVFADKNHHVNINANVLHLWCCLEGDPLPEFSFGGSI